MCETGLESRLVYSPILDLKRNISWTVFSNSAVQYERSAAVPRSCVAATGEMSLALNFLQSSLYCPYRGDLPCPAVRLWEAVLLPLSLFLSFFSLSAQGDSQTFRSVLAEVTTTQLWFESGNGRAKPHNPQSTERFTQKSPAEREKSRKTDRV